MTSYALLYVRSMTPSHSFSVSAYSQMHADVVQMVNALAVLYVEPGVGHAGTAGMHKAVKEFLDMYLRGPAWRQRFSADTRARLVSLAT